MSMYGRLMRTSASSSRGAWHSGAAIRNADVNWLLSRASICAGPPDSPCVAMSRGNVPVDVSMPTPCACSAAMSVCMGRRFICAVESKWYRPCPAATEASRKRAAVPALPHHTDALSLADRPRRP